MSGLTRAVTWTQRIGYSYPAEIFQPAVKATFPRLTDPEVRHCVHEHRRCVAEWEARIAADQWVDAWAEHRERV